MDNRAVGILEVYGLVCAFMAADAGCKAANINLDAFIDQLVAYIDQTIAFVNDMNSAK